MQEQDLSVRAVVVGAGIAGCASALGLARGGHDVVVVDRAAAASLRGSSAADVFASWQRPGVAHFRQPHNFLGLARVLLRDRFPDVYAALLLAGATEVDQSRFLGDAARQPGDDQLATIACRRPVFDAALRDAMLEQHRVTFRAADVVGLRMAAGRVGGVVLGSGESVDVDLVVDASGRNSHASDWFVAADVVPPPAKSTECGLLYYSRHYRVRDGQDMPGYASLLGGPRADLGYLAFAVFIGDNGTFCLCIMAPPWDKPFRSLRDPGGYQRVAARLPGMGPWLDIADPVTPVLPMGQLRNTVRQPPPITGFVAIGDARCHTNPTFAFGASLAVWHAVVLADLATSAADLGELGGAFARAIGPDALERFRAVSAEDADRVRMWSGQPIDVTDRDDSMPMFLRSVVYRVAPRDPQLLRAVARRINALDPVESLARHRHLLDRAESLYREGSAAAPEIPPRSALLAALEQS